AIAIGNNNAVTTLAITGGDEWSIDAAGDAVFEDITAASLTIGTTGLSETTSPTDSGAFLIGVNDELANSDSTNVQDVLDDLDADITTALAGDISSVIAGVGISGGGTTGDVTVTFS